MHRKIRWLVLGILLSSIAPSALGQLGGKAAIPDPDAVPDKDATRKGVEDVIASFKKGNAKATLGMVQECMDISISFGAPSWNAGDHAACCEFYRQTAQELVDAFGKDGAATPAAAASIADLKAALARVKNSNDTDQKAWALRYAFDKAQLSCEEQFAKMDGMLSLGSDYLGRQDVEDAQDAFTQALAMLPEMQGRDKEKLPAVWRIAPLVAANGQVAQKKYREAAGAIAAGVEALPEWAASHTDLRAAMGGPEVLAGMVGDIKAQAQREPQDAKLQFLLGYELNFSGDRDGAKTYLRQALTLDPTMKAAQILLDTAPPEQKPPPLDLRRVG